MKLRRSLMWFLVLAMVLSVALTGCGDKGTPTGSETPSAAPANNQGNETSAPAQTALQPLELTVFVSDPGYQSPPADNPIYKMIKDEFGITFKWDLLVGDKDQKIGVMTAGGDYPDITTIDTYSYPKFKDAGALIALDDLIKNHAPNLLDHYKEVWNMAKDPNDGKFYVMPNYGVYHGTFTANTWEGIGFWLQKDVLADAGYPAPPKTLDEYFGLIEAYMAKYPAIDGNPTIGFEILCEGWRDFCLKHPPEHLMGRPNDGDCMDINGKATMFNNTPEAKAYYKKLNEEFLKGVVDPEFFALTYDAYMAKLSQGNVLGMFDQHWDFGNAELNLLNEGKPERTWVACELTLPGYKPYYQDRPVVNINTGFALTVSCKDPERVIKFFDGLMTERWQVLLGWGREGIDYSVDSSGKFYLTQQQADQNNDQAYRLANRAHTLWNYGPKMEGTFSDGNACNPGSSRQVFYDSLKDYDKDFLSKYGFQCWADFLSPAPPNDVTYPLWNIAIPAGSDAEAAKTQWEEMGTRYLPRVILAQPGEFDAIWDEYMGELAKINIKDYTDYVTSQLDWRRQNWSAN